MNATPIFWPAFAMVLLTFAVMFKMGHTRFSTMSRERIHPQRVATSGQMAATIADTRAADNFRNLFEFPVLFYAALFVAHLTGQTGTLVLGMAWTFVGLRVVHSAIHCTYNTVMHRFQVFLAGTLVLLALWVVLAFGWGA